MNDLLRHRQRGGFLPTPEVVRSETRGGTCAHINWVEYASVPECTVLGVVQTFDDVVTKGFKVRQARGEIISNPMASSLHSVTMLPGFGYRIRQLPGYNCSGIQDYFESRAIGPWFTALMVALHNANDKTKPFNASPIVSQDDIVGLQKEVSTKCQAERGNSKNNLFESIAEYRQTLSMLKSPLKSVHRWLNQTEKSIAKKKLKLSKNPVSALERASQVSAAWLTYRYGVRPLIKDMEGIIEGFKEKIGRMRITSRSRGEILRNEVITPTWTGAIFTLKYGIQKTELIRVRASSLDEYVVDRSERIGFASKGLIVVPWELVPYSFVADWFVNLGDFIKAMIPLPSLEQLGSSLTTETITQTTYTPLHTAAVAGWEVVTPTSGLLVATRKSKTRGLLLAPSIVLKSDFRFDDSIRVFDAVSLIVQRMNRIFLPR